MRAAIQTGLRSLEMREIPPPMREADEALSGIDAGKRREIARVIVELLQPLGGTACRVKGQNAPVPKHGAHDAVALPAAGARERAYSGKGQPTGPRQPPGKGHVFHQGPGRKAPAPFVGRAPGKDRLVAIGQAKEPAAECDSRLDAPVGPPG
jgi:hypothetical protein